MIYHYYEERRRRLSQIAIIFLGLLIVLGVFGLVRLRSMFISIEYQIGSLEKKKMDAFQEQKRFEAELAAALSIQEVEGREIALVFPDRQKVVYVKRDSGGVPYTASLKR